MTDTDIDTSLLAFSQSWPKIFPLKSVLFSLQMKPEITLQLQAPKEMGI